MAALVERSRLNIQTLQLRSELLWLKEDFRTIINRPIKVISNDKKTEMYTEMSSIHQGLDTIPTAISTIEVLETRKNLAVRLHVLREEIHYYRNLYYLIDESSAESCMDM